MDICFIQSSLGIIKITGDQNGIVAILVLTDGELTTIIPENLKVAVLQLQDYFEGKRTNFTFKLNPSGTDFQKKVWQELINIPFGKTISYLH